LLLKEKAKAETKKHIPVIPTEGRNPYDATFKEGW